MYASIMTLNIQKNGTVEKNCMASPKVGLTETL